MKICKTSIEIGMWLNQAILLELDQPDSSELRIHRNEIESRDDIIEHVTVSRDILGHGIYCHQ